MSHKAKNRSLVILAVLLALTACGLIAGTIYALRLPDQIAEQDTIILGQSRLIPGAPGVLHVQVQRHDNAAAVAGAEVEVSLRPRRAAVLKPCMLGQPARMDAWLPSSPFPT